MKAMSANALESWSLNQVSLTHDTQLFDITTMIQTIVIEEDMEKGFIRGTIAFVDTMNLMETLGMKGEDYLYISFNSLKHDLTEKDPYKKLFRVIGYVELTEPNLGTKRAIQMDFCTPSEITNEYKSISKSYVNSSSNQIVSEMLKIIETEGEPEIEETLFMKDLVIPNITPLEVISFLAKNSISKETGDSNFYFFENRDGVHFVSGQKLIKQVPFEIIVEGTNPSDLQMYKKATKYQKAKGYDMLQQFRSGAAGLNMMMRDGLRKGYKEEAISFKKTKEQFPLLNEVEAVIVPEDASTMMQEYISVEQMYQFNNKSSYGNMTANRIINRNSMSTKRSFLETPGDSDMSAGMLIDLKIANQKGQVSKRDSGKWLITKCRHIININIGQYRQELDLISDSNIG